LFHARRFRFSFRAATTAENGFLQCAEEADLAAAVAVFLGLHLTAVRRLEVCRFVEMRARGRRVRTVGGEG
jgi:hypothetical protein